MKSIYKRYKKYLLLITSLFLIAVTYNLFIIPLKLVAGGSGGLGVLFYNLFGFEPSLVIFAISVIMFFVSYFVLDFKDMVSVLIVSVVYPIFVKLTYGITDIISIDYSHVLVVVLFGGILTGACQGFIFKEGLNIGGLSILAKVINKYTKISVTLCNAIINGIIILLGAFFIDFSMTLYALVFVFILRFVSERIFLGTSNNKTFQIISTKYADIEKFLYSLGHDVTVYDTVGLYNGFKRKLIMTVVPTSQFVLLKEYIKSVDKNAFIFVTNTYEAKMQDVSIRKGFN